MLLLTATSHSLELETGAAVSTDWSASYVEHDGATPAFTPSSGHGNVSSATTTTIVSTPGSGVQRQVQSVTVRNRSTTANQQVALKKDVSGTDYYLTPPIVLRPGEVLHYTDGKGFQTYDAAGRLKVPHANVTPTPTLDLPPGFQTGGTGSTKTLTSGTAFAVYLGRAPWSVSQVTLAYRTTTAEASGTWGELAIATGTPVLAGNPSLTVVGYTDTWNGGSGDFATTAGVKTTVVPVASGQAVVEGDDVWVIFANTATTAAVIRAASVADNLGAGFQAAATSTRPSSIAGTPTSFTVEGTSVLGPWCAVLWG